MILFLSLLGCDDAPEAPFEPDLQCEPGLPTVGAAPLRRLTRAQYDHTVRDLLGVTGSYGALLDADEHVGPFASNGVTPVSLATVDQYMRAAEAAAGDADLAALSPCNLLAERAGACARRYIEEMLPRVLRRPPTDERVERLFALYDAFADRGHFEALRVVTTAMLQAPEFLYHVEDGVPGGEGAARLDGFTIASRLSFFLWNGGPDDALLDAAAQGRLDTADGIRDVALDMLADPRAARGIGRLHQEWLGVDELGSVSKDPVLFPDYDEAIAAAMIEDVGAFANEVVRHGDGSLTTLLTARHHVGDEPERSGILTLPGVLAAHAHHQRASLTLRGKLVREDLLCQQLPDPPPDVDLSLPDVTEGTTREVVSAHLAQEGCAPCHSLIDPIGFAFESYDAVGAWRATENGSPIDTTAELTASDVDGIYADAEELTAALAESGEVRWCVARQWFRFAHGRTEQPADTCSLEAAWSAMQQPDNLRELVVAIVTSDAFRHRSTR